jgi:hypothetical protein
MYRKGKDIRKKRHLAAFVFVPSVFGGEVSNSILSDIGRNCLLGNRKKIAKCVTLPSSMDLKIPTFFFISSYRIWFHPPALSRQLSYAGCTCYTQREESLRERERGKECWVRTAG